MVRVDGELSALAERPITDNDLDATLVRVTERSPAKRDQFYASGDLDTAYTAANVGPLRVNGFRQRGSVSFAFRYVPKAVPTFAELGLPRGVETLADEHRGLVLVVHAGPPARPPAGSRRDPDRGSFATRTPPARRSRRPSPGTSSSRRCTRSTRPRRSGRLIEFFPPAKQLMVRQILAGVLRGVVSQRLLPRIGGGRLAAVEVMVNTARIADLIREPEKTEGITDAIEEGSFHQMQSFAQHLVQLVLEEKVAFETAAAAATNRHDFELAVEQALRAKRAAESGAAANGDGTAERAEPKAPPGLRLAGS